MNEMVKYNNALNHLQFTNFTPMDYNIFMCLCHKLRNRGTDKVTLSFKELKKLSEFGNHTDKSFVEALDRMIDKLIKVNTDFIDGDDEAKFVLFPTFVKNEKKATLTVSVNSDYVFILNELSNNFTVFELKEFAELDGKYAKNLYRFLKQYRSSGWWKPTIEEFIFTMDIPETTDRKRIMPEIIKPTLERLDGKFKDLKCEPIKAKKRGAPIERFSFSFEPEEIKNEEESSKITEFNKKAVQKSSFHKYQQNKEDYEELEKLLVENI